MISLWSFYWRNGRSVDVDSADGLSLVVCLVGDCVGEDVGADGGGINDAGNLYVLGDISVSIIYASVSWFVECVSDSKIHKVNPQQSDNRRNGVRVIVSIRRRIRVAT